MDDYNMTMVQGDTLAFAVEIEGYEGEVTAAEFAAKMDLEDELAIRKTLGEGIEYAGETEEGVAYNVTVNPEDTEDLPIGQYYYQLKMNFEGDIFTVLKGILKIERSVGNVQE